MQTHATRILMKAKYSLEFASVLHEEPRKSEENTSLITKSITQSCAFLRDLIEIWCTIWHVSVGIALGVFRNHKRILCFCKNLLRWHMWRFNKAIFNGMKVKLAFLLMSARFITSWFGYVAMQVRHLASWSNSETRVLACDLRDVILYNRQGLVFFSISSLALNLWCYQVSVSHKLIWLHGNAHHASGFVTEPWKLGARMWFKMP